MAVAIVVLALRMARHDAAMDLRSLRMLASEECRSFDKRNSLTEYDVHAVDEEVGMFTSNISHQLD